MPGLIVEVIVFHQPANQWLILFNAVINSLSFVSFSKNRLVNRVALRLSK